MHVKNLECFPPAKYGAKNAYFGQFWTISVLHVHKISPGPTEILVPGPHPDQPLLVVCFHALVQLNTAEIAVAQ